MEENNINPIDVQTYISKVKYPARPENLVSHARDHGADEMVLVALSELPEREYGSAGEVNEVINKLGSENEDDTAFEEGDM